MRYHVTIAGREIEVDLSGASPRIDGAELTSELVTVPGSSVRSLLIRGMSHALIAEQGARRGEWSIVIRGRRYLVEVVDERTRAIRQMTGGAEVATVRSVEAPMPGLVVRVDVEPGQRVRAGESVVAIEAMKMENELRAPADGTVLRVEVETGRTVEKGTVLVVLE